MRIARGGIVALAGAAALVLAAGDAAAGGVNGREANQRERIRSGVESGALTGPEAHRLAHQQQRIERTERRMRADDGALGPRERARLDHRLDHASRDVHRLKHNDRTR